MILCCSAARPPGIPEEIFIPAAQMATYPNEAVAWWAGIRGGLGEPKLMSSAASCAGCGGQPLTRARAKAKQQLPGSDLWPACPPTAAAPCSTTAGPAAEARLCPGASPGRCALPFRSQLPVGHSGHSVPLERLPVLSRA